MTITQEEIIAGLGEIIEEVSGADPAAITMDTNYARDLQLDSLSLVEIAVAAENKYGVKIPEQDLSKLKTVGATVEYIQRLEEQNPEAAAALRAAHEERPQT